MNRYKFLFLCLGLLGGMHLAEKDFYVTDFGVKADGKTLNTNSIQKGIDQSVGLRKRFVYSLDVYDF